MALRKILTLAACAATLMSAAGAAQEVPISGPPTQSEAINVFLDCNSCDTEYIRTEVTFINWVRERTVADVHLLVTTVGTGGGGTRYIASFIGQRAFAGVIDTLTYSALADNTSEERRRGLLVILKAGLVRFVARTPAGARLQIGMGSTPGRPPGAQMTTGRDPWHAWVFTTSANAYSNGEKSYQSASIYSYFSASRTTEAWKSSFDFNYSYDDSKTTFDGFDDAGNPIVEKFTTIQRNWGFSTLQVKSLTKHTSAGINASLGSNTYVNQRHHARVAPAIEWDLYPYSEWTRRRLTVQYGVGVDFYRYEDTTVFLKTEETLPVNYLSIGYATRQTWGSSSISAYHSQFLNDPQKRNTRLNGNMSVRLFKGFSVNFSGSYSWIHDQIYLRKGSRDQAEVLLRQQQLLTGYRYYYSAGLSYRFGSVFNNVVNPRFGGSGGEFCC